MGGEAVKVARNKWPENPGYHLTVEPYAGRVRVTFEGAVIADSTRALVLREQGHAPVFYFPRDDLRMNLLRRTDHRTHCAYKGHCSYYSIVVDGRVSENAVWTYEDPYPEMARIAGLAAFYADRVSSIDAD